MFSSALSRPVFSNVNNISISPENPVIGDLIELSFLAEENGTLPVSISYNQTIQLVSREFSWDYGILMVAHLPSSISITTKDLNLLSVDVGTQFTQILQI